MHLIVASTPVSLYSANRYVYHTRCLVLKGDGVLKEGDSMDKISFVYNSVQYCPMLVFCIIRNVSRQIPRCQTFLVKPKNKYQCQK